MSDTASKNYRIVVADDDGQLSRRFTDYLKEKNFDARAVSSGAELKALIKDPSWVPHFILMDLMLPQCTASEALSLLKTLLHTKDADVRVLVTSGHNSLQNVKDCMRSGAA